MSPGHIHVLGVCGTFMGGVALLARALGWRVTGSDANVYPPMSELLAEQGIAVREGYDPAHLEPPPDQVVIGNALSRGNPAVEHVLDAELPYTSGPAWLAEHALRGRWVLAVAGTHGKTTTSSMLAWILEHGGLAPGFLIGGVPGNFGVSARLGAGRHFVVEADEYDTAFFDKRSKLVHYRPRTAVLNNLEWDHADIFPDLASIQRQIHHFVRTIPGRGRILRPRADPALDEALALGCWTPVETFGPEGDWSARLLAEDGSRFTVAHGGMPAGEVAWPLAGLHNVDNALAAIGAAAHAGVDPAAACAALGTFRNVRRRLELRGTAGGIDVYDDFAHHPTAIRLTVDALRRRDPARRILAVLEPRSNTMRMGVHRDRLAGALEAADRAILHQAPGLAWDPADALAPLGARAESLPSVSAIVARVAELARPGDRVLVMSNGGFEGIHGRLLEALGEAGAGPAPEPPP